MRTYTIKVTVTANYTEEVQIEAEDEYDAKELAEEQMADEILDNIDFFCRIETEVTDYGGGKE